MPDVYLTINDADPALLAEIADGLELRAALPQQVEILDTYLGDIEFSDGARVLVELSIIHDWSTNRWIAGLNRDTDHLDRAMLAGPVSLQIILAVAPTSVAAEPTRMTWLSMAKVWNQPTEFERTLPLAGGGEGLMRGWVAAKSAETLKL